MQLVSDSVINPNACNNGTIYFNGTETDHYLYGLDTRTDSIYTVYKGNLWYPAYHNNYIYYMDVSSDYRLCRYSLIDNTVEILTTDRVDTFNVGDFFIYYQKNSADSPALMRMELDGSNPEVVAEGNYTNINIIPALKRIENPIFLIGNRETDESFQILDSYIKYDERIETAYISNCKKLPQLEAPDKLYKILCMLDES